MKPLSCSSGPLAKIVQNIVTTEAIAAYFDQIMDMNGKKTEKCNEILAAGAGVIDIGWTYDRLRRRLSARHPSGRQPFGVQRHRHAQTRRAGQSLPALQVRS